MTAGPQPRPRLRGVVHTYSFLAALGAGAALVVFSPTERARAAAAVYAAALAGLFGTSALYHRVTWSIRARRWMRRLDHSMIFVLIAGTFTPFAVVLGGDRAGGMLARVWLAAAAAVLVKLFWIDGPKWVSVVLALAMGWLIAGAAPALALGTGVAAAALVMTGGLLYTAGALAYAFRRPNPAAGVFGYHEVFHSCVSAAALAHFTAIAVFVVPRG
ncbi:MAG TPA: hemolysin III family protein [Chloroflexota bacterium]|nr:hemolysin III family protein [Chloroflexota bacterium]